MQRRAIGLAMAMVAALTPMAAQAHRAILADNAVRSFVPSVEAFIATLPVETEAFSVRINRCTGQQGELSDLMYYVWVGWRGTVSSAAEVLQDVHRTWGSEGWEIIRNRQLDNGGLNIAATDPATGNSYSLDSGFAAGPDTYIVGYFNTRCLEHASGAAPFGPFAWPGT